MSLFDAAVDLNPHQIEAALFALESPLSKGVILADEVGLGKTIEAAIVLCQFWAERKRRLLVICPASLRKQWALELEEKFSLPTRVLDAKAYGEEHGKSGRTTWCFRPRRRCRTPRSRSSCCAARRGRLQRMQSNTEFRRTSKT